MTADNSGSLTVGLRGVSIGLTVLTLASITSTVVVVSLKNADELSVVALALAIIAFVIQIILYVVQQSFATTQSDRASDLYTQTIRALASIEEKAEGTKQTVVQINDRLLGVALTKATNEAAVGAAGEPTSDFVDRVVQRTREIVERSAAHPSTNTSDELDSVEPRSTFLDAIGIQPELRDEATAIGKDLTGIETTAIRSLARDLESAERSGRPQQAGLSILNTPESLYAKRLIKRVRVPWSKNPVFRLTDLGKAVAQLLLGNIEGVENNEDVMTLRRTLVGWDQNLRRFQEGLRRSDLAVPVEDEPSVSS